MPPTTNEHQSVNAESDSDTALHSETIDTEQNPLMNGASPTKADSVPTGTSTSSTPHQPAPEVNNDSSPVTTSSPPPRYTEIREVIDITSSTKDIVRHIVQRSGSTTFCIAPDDFEAATEGIDPQMKAALKETLTDYSRALKVNPTFEIKFESTHGNFFDNNTSYAQSLYASFIRIHIAKTAKRILERASDLKSLQRIRDEQLAQVRASEHGAATDVDKQYADLTWQLERKQWSLRFLKERTIPDKTEESKLTSSISSLEQKLKKLTVTRNEEKERNENSLSALKTSEKCNEIHNTIIKMLAYFRFYAGSRMAFTSKSTGCLIYVKNDSILYYNMLLKDSLSDMPTTEAYERKISSIPSTYFTDVLSIFKDATLRSHLVRENVFDNFDETYSAWNASKKVATLEITSTDKKSPIQGYALFRTHQSDEMLLPQALSHFDDVKSVKIDILLRRNPPARLYPDLEHEAYALLAYSSTDKPPRREAPSSVGQSQFIVLTQTESEFR